MVLLIGTINNKENRRKRSNEKRKGRTRGRKRIRETT
jgi:hypothetical protein